MFSSERHELRQFFVDCYEKMQQNLDLTPLEIQVAEVIATHPEYHQYLRNEAALEQNFIPELGQANPFLHMSLHLSIQEQVGTDRPAGIRAIYQTLCQHFGQQETEHQMMEPLMEQLWRSMKQGTLPDEVEYLAALATLLQTVSRKPL